MGSSPCRTKKESPDGQQDSNTLWCKRRPAGVYQQSTGLLIEWVRAPAAPKKRALTGNRTRIHYGVNAVQPAFTSSPQDC